LHGCNHGFANAQQLAKHMLLLKGCWVPQENLQSCMVCEGQHGAAFDAAVVMLRWIKAVHCRWP
jgi:hypothetical protein